MAARSQGAKVYPVSVDYFVQKLRMIQTSGLNMIFNSETPTPYGVQFHLSRGISLTSWGETITVTLTDQGGSTNVGIVSECALPTQIVDWGKNNQNVQSIFTYLEQDMAAMYETPAYQTAGTSSMAENRAAPAQSQQNASAPQFQATPQNGTRYCTKCGTPAPAQARFCSACGSPLAD